MLRLLLFAAVSHAASSKRLALRGLEQRVVRASEPPPQGTQYMCLQHFKKPSMQSEYVFTDEFCLLEFENVRALSEDAQVSRGLTGAQPDPKASITVEPCKANNHEGMMRICGFEEASHRLSYDTRWYYPEACFVELAGSRAALLEVAMSPSRCEEVSTSKQFIQNLTASHGTTPESEATEDSEEDEDADIDWFGFGSGVLVEQKESDAIQGDGEEDGVEHDGNHELRNPAEQWLRQAGGEAGTVDVTPLLEDDPSMEATGKLRCCCDAPSTASWFHSAIARSGLCKVIPGVSTCGQRPDWATGQLHHYKKTGDGVCKVSSGDLDSVYLLFGQSRLSSQLFDVTDVIEANSLSELGYIRCCCDIPGSGVCEVFAQVSKCGNQRLSSSEQTGRLHHYSKVGGRCTILESEVEVVMALSFVKPDVS